MEVKVAGEIKGRHLREASIQGVDFKDRFGIRVKC
jgi:hypothetical protein